MKTGTYKLGQSLLAYTLLFAFLLQSCTNLSVSLIPIEEAQISSPRKDNSKAKARGIEGVKLVAQRGHIVTINQRLDLLEATVEEHLPEGFSKTHYSVPVYLAPNMEIKRISKLQEEEQKKLVEVRLPTATQKGYAYVGRRGLLGGMKRASYRIENKEEQGLSSQRQDSFLQLSEKDFIKGQILGRGVAGTVYKCKLTNNRGVYALKEIILPHATSKGQKGQVAEYHRELNLLKKLNHQNIVHLIGYHIPLEQDRLLLIMDLYDTSLRSYLTGVQNNKANWHKSKEILLPPSVTTQVAKDILSGLSYLHDQQITHRDIKADNVLLSLNGLSTIASAHLADFGVSHMVENTMSSLTIGGTLGYMAPEVLKYLMNRESKIKYDPFKADIYSFGRMLYECVTGKVPEGKLSIPKDGDKDHRILVKMFKKCTKENPKHRPTCKELLTSIGEEVLEEEESESESKQIEYEESIYKLCLSRANQGHAEAQWNLGWMYANGKEGVTQDYKQALVWYQQAADKGYTEAQYCLGRIYCDGYEIKIDYKKAAELFQKAALQGHRLAKARLARMYYNGWGVKENREEARKLVDQVSTYIQENASINEQGCQFMLGWMHENGQGVSKNAKEAIRWYQKAAEQGYAAAQCNLGWMYENGYGATKNEQEATKWYLKAAEQGYADAQYNLGWIYTNGQGISKNDKEAVKWYLRAAEQGLAEAQFNLGMIYEKGQGISRNDQEAIKWYLKAAEQGYAEAQNNLGLQYANGQGVSKNTEEAVKWYQKAADQGLATAQYNLGVRYENGIGVKKDDEKAMFWYQKAADQGLAQAQCSLGWMHVNGQNVQQDTKKAAFWYRKAADQGHAVAQHNLGLMYANGQGAQQDIKKAAFWYQKAADQGHAVAQYNLGLMYANGQGAQQDTKKAAFWYRKAADQGHAVAQYNLGLMYANGQGVKRSDKKAVFWYQKAAIQGDMAAQYNLGLMCERGQGVQQDARKAAFWYKKAADQGHAQAQERLDELNNCALM